MKTIEFLNEKLEEEGNRIESTFFDAAVKMVTDPEDIKAFTYYAGDWHVTTIIVVPRQGREHIEDVMAFGPRAEKILNLLASRES